MLTAEYAFPGYATNIAKNRTTMSNVMRTQPHCQKCGRRSRIQYPRTDSGVHHGRKINAPQPEQRFKCNRQGCLNPPASLPYPMSSQINDNRYLADLPDASVNRNSLRRNTSEKFRAKNVLIDQFIQVQQLDADLPPDGVSSAPGTRVGKLSTSHRKRDSNSSSPVGKPHRVQQMIYLRENINKSVLESIRL